jgi:hypothetical protein
MSDLFSKNRKLLLVPGVALVFFLGAFFYYYRGVYTPPPPPIAPLDEIVAPASVFDGPGEVVPRRDQGRVVAIDAAHRNRFSTGEIVALEGKIGERGYDTELIGSFASLNAAERMALLEPALRRADSLVVAMPGEPYSTAEAALVQRFVEKGGRLLLVGDPTRESQINSLAAPFGIAFQRDYLYNTAEYDLNFQYIHVRNFQPDELTQGLGEVILYGAGSIRSLGPGLASADGQTRSSLTTEGTQSFYTLVRGNTGQVVGLSDLTFMVPPQDSIRDNGRLLSNLAAYLTTSQRRFELADYPHFLRGEAQVLVTRPELFSAATKLRGHLASQQATSQFSREDDLSRDAVILGLFQDAAQLVPYLEGAGVRVGSTVGTPFTAELPLGQTAVLVLHRSHERNVLVALADTPETLGGLVGRLSPTGDFRIGLVDELVGVYRP